METQSKGIQPHNHDMTTLRSLADTYANMKYKDSYTYKYDKGVYDVGFLNDEHTVKINGDDKKVRFQDSDNLFDDFCALFNIISTNNKKRIDREESIRTYIDGEISKIYSKRASTTDYGFVKIDPNAGLIVDDGVLGADFSSLQEKLVPGENIKNINGHSLIPTEGDTELNLELVTSGDFNTLLRKVFDVDLVSDIPNMTRRYTVVENGVEVERTVSYTSLLGYLNANIDDFNAKVTVMIRDVQDTVTKLEGLMIDILHEVQNLQMTYGGSSAASSGLVKFDSSKQPVCSDCDNVILLPTASYYCKKLVQDNLSGCVDPGSSSPFFNFDTSKLIVTDTDYMVIHFYLDIETTKATGNQIATSDADLDRLPWTWIGTKPNKDSFSGQHNIVIEIHGYYKCQTWNFFGKVFDIQTMICEE